MKKIFVLALVLMSLKSFAQYPNGKQIIGNDSNVVETKGAHQARVINKVYTDTAAANLQRIKQYPGAQIFTTSDNKFWLRDATATTWINVGASLSTVSIIDSSHIQVCVIGGICTVFNTTVNAQLVTITSDSTLLVCDTLGNCETLNIPHSVFIQNLFDTTTIYQSIQNVYQYIFDTSFTNQFFPRGDGVLQDTTYWSNDTTENYVYTDGTIVPHTFPGFVTTTNIYNLIDTIPDTLFVNSPTYHSGFVLKGADTTGKNHTLTLKFPPNNAPLDSVLSTDAGGNIIMKLVTSGSSVTTTDSILVYSASSAFTFPGVPSTYSDYMVFRNSVLLESTHDYTTSGNVITVLLPLDAALLAFAARPSNMPEFLM